MGSEWKLKCLGELGIQLIDGDRGKNYPKQNDFTASGDCLFLSAKNVTNLGFSFEDQSYISKEKSDSLRAGKLDRGDLVLTTRGTIGNVALYDETVPFDLIRINSGMMIIRADKRSWNPEFLYFVFSSPFIRSQINALTSGSAVPQLPGRDIKKFQLPELSKKQQDVIAYQLSTLNEKITLNRQINQTLEQMAQALFKSWFVDFDPVIDNALAAGNPIPDELQPRAEQRKALQLKASGENDSEGAYKPLPESVRTLFPDAFEESELGWVPEGWGTVLLSEHVTVTKGKSYKSSELADSNTALVTLKSFQRGGGYRLDGLKPYTGKYKPEQEVKAGDLIIAYTDVTQAADVIGKPAIVISDDSFEHLVVSLDVAVVRPQKDYLKYFLYAMAKTPKFQSYTYAHSTGTTVLHLSKNAVPDYQFAMPNTGALEFYHSTVDSLFQSIEGNISEARTLTNLRDTLLPKLISGELQLDQLPDVVESVA